jgi:hypothetical protein
MVLANNFCAPVYVIRYWIDALCSPMDLSSKRSSIDTIYGSGTVKVAYIGDVVSSTGGGSVKSRKVASVSSQVRLFALA